MVDKLPLHSFPANWENFPDENIKFIRNKKEFNEKLKTYFFKQLSYKVTCTHCLKNGPHFTFYTAEAKNAILYRA
jgi:hypothetical protein